MTTSRDDQRPEQAPDTEQPKILEQTDKQLPENEDKLNAILQLVSDHMSVMDKDLNIVWANDAVKRVFGEDVVGKKCYEAYHGRMTPCEPNPCPILQAFAGGFAPERETEIIGRDGRAITFHCTGKVAWRDEQGAPMAVLEISRDITELKRAERRMIRTNHLQTELLKPGGLTEKAQKITDAVVEIFDADFARIWITGTGDLCDSGCMHAEITEGPHVCRHRDRCLCLRASSGRYTHLDGNVHKRVPFGCYKIGRVAAEEERKFLTNEVTTAPRVHNHQWAAELGLRSFAGYQLRPPGGRTIGVLALFSKHRIRPEEDAALESISNIGRPGGSDGLGRGASGRDYRAVGAS